MIRLLIEKWFEPPRANGLHASTLVQQCLSTIAQQGGAHASHLWNELIASGTFAAVDKTDFMALLKELGEKKLIVQTALACYCLARSVKSWSTTMSFTVHSAAMRNSDCFAMASRWVPFLSVAR